MKINRTEFENLLLLYAANIDGQIHPDELAKIMERNNATEFGETLKKFKKMSDFEILECINENKATYSTTEKRQQLLDDLRAVIEADEKLTSVENYLYKNIEKLINE